MAKRTTKNADSLKEDPAAKAWRLVQSAGEDDKAYDAAIDGFETASVSTPKGLKLKQKLHRMRMSDISDGDTMNFQGHMRMRALERSINEGILLWLFVITAPPLLMLGLGFLKAARALYQKRPSQ